MTDAAAANAGVSNATAEAPPSPTASSSGAAQPIEEMDSAMMRTELHRLDDEKRRLEQALTDALHYLSTTPVGLYGRLVDDEGFPRSDCDLYAVRTARNTADCARNDLRDVQERMYALLNALHDSTKAEAELQMVQDAGARRQRQAAVEKRARRLAEVQRVGKLKPCLVVAAVQAGSPAAEAGLGPGMRILQYGAVTHVELAAEGLQALAKETSSHEGEPITMWVTKPGDAADDDPVDLVLVPQRWSGQGLLGCALDLIDDSA